MKGLNSVKTKSEEIIQILVESGHEKLAESMRQEIAKLDFESKRLEGLSEICGCCHVKSFGDLSIPSLNSTEWFNKLGKLQRKCKQLIRSIRNAT